MESFPSSRRRRREATSRYMDTALGAVTPIYTVTVKSRVDGQLMNIHFKEGEMVNQDDALIEIDTRPYQASLDQANGQLVRDQALLKNAQIDLARYKVLVTQQAIPEQQLATQDALVAQYEGGPSNPTRLPSITRS